MRKAVETTADHGPCLWMSCFKPVTHEVINIAGNNEGHGCEIHAHALKWRLNGGTHHGLKPQNSST